MKRTILFVEDDNAVRSAFAELLKMKGFHVLQASDGLVALQVSREYKDEIDILVSDCVLAKLSGPKLAEQLKKERPNIKIIHISGYSDGTMPKNLTLDPDAVFLSKPVSINALLQSITKLLSGNRN